MHKIYVKTTTNSIDDIKNPVSEFLDSQRCDNLFLRPFWLKFIESISHKPVYFIAFKSDRICGFMPSFIQRKGPFNQLCSLPRGGGGICLGRDSKQVISLILHECDAFCRKNRLASRRFSITSSAAIGYLGILSEFGYSLSHVNCRMELPILENDDAQMSICSTSRRNEIRQAMERGCHVEQPSPDDFLKDFYPIYESTIQKHGGNTQPMESLKLLISAGGDSVQGLLARVDGRPAGGILLLHNRLAKRSHYYLGAMDRSISRHRPIELLLLAALRQAREYGFSIFDMMGTSADFRSGLFHYKKEWGANATPNIYMENNSVLFGTLRKFRSLLTKETS